MILLLSPLYDILQRAGTPKDNRPASAGAFDP